MISFVDQKKNMSLNAFLPEHLSLPDSEYVRGLIRQRSEYAAKKAWRYVSIIDFELEQISLQNRKFNKVYSAGKC